jgi:hypothetical protein
MTDIVGKQAGGIGKITTFAAHSTKKISNGTDWQTKHTQGDSAC